MTVASPIRFELVASRLPALVFSACCALVFCVSGDAGWAQSSEPGGGSPRAGQRAGRGGDPAQRLWWNRQQFAARLELSTEQRQAMDERFTERLEERRTSARRYGELRREMGKALVAGDWKLAAEKIEEASAAMAATNASDNALVADVMKVLSVEQRERLATLYPRLLERPWLVGGFKAR